MYGSSFTIAILRPRASRIAPSDAAAMPFPKEETTPPVTKTNRVMWEPVRVRMVRSTGGQVIEVGRATKPQKGICLARAHTSRARRRDLSFAATDASIQRSPAHRRNTRLPRTDQRQLRARFHGHLRRLDEFLQRLRPCARPGTQRLTAGASANLEMSSATHRDRSARRHRRSSVSVSPARFRAHSRSRAQCHDFEINSMADSTAIRATSPRASDGPRGAG